MEREVIICSLVVSYWQVLLAWSLSAERETLMQENCDQCKQYVSTSACVSTLTGISLKNILRYIVANKCISWQKM